MVADFITRQHLLLAGFTRMPDVWRYCAERRCHEYFERWYHPDLNISVFPGFADTVSFEMTVAEFHELLTAACHQGAELLA